ncbi:MAG: alpha/beta fold hydrolase [Rhizobiaceae bacterium]
MFADGSGDGQVSDRSAELHYWQQTFSVQRPADSGLSEPASGSGKPIANAPQLLNGEAFANRLAASRKNGKPQIGVFVHGYNTTYGEAVAHVAEMAAGADGSLTPVLFAWPSSGRPTGYVADRDAAAFSRDALVELISGLTSDKRLGEVTIIAHSMGALLTVEALRQLRLGGETRRFSGLRVILAAPDIDIDLFRSQIKKIGPLPNPMILLVSPDDRILRLSGRIGGDRRRLGSLSGDDPRVAAGAREAGLVVVDISGASGGNSLNHDKYIELANRYKNLASAKEPILRRRSGAYLLDPGGLKLISGD